MNNINTHSSKRPKGLWEYFLWPVLVGIALLYIFNPLSNYFTFFRRATVPLTVTYKGKPAVGARITLENDLLDTIDETGIGILNRQRLGRNKYYISFKKRTYPCTISIYDDGVFPFKRELYDDTSAVTHIKKSTSSDTILNPIKQLTGNPPTNKVSVPKKTELTGNANKVSSKFWDEIANKSTDIWDNVKPSKGFLSSFPESDVPKVSHSYDGSFYPWYSSQEGGVLFWTNCQGCNWKIEVVGGRNYIFYSSYDSQPKIVSKDLVFLIRDIYSPFRFSILDRTGKLYGVYNLTVVEGNTLVIKIQKKS